MSHKLPEDDPDHEYVGPNVYADDEVPQMRAVVDELYERQDKMARMMFQAFAEMFQLSADTFSKHFVAFFVELAVALLSRL